MFSHHLSLDPSRNIYHCDTCPGFLRLDLLFLPPSIRSPFFTSRTPISLGGETCPAPSSGGLVRLRPSLLGLCENLHRPSPSHSDWFRVEHMTPNGPISIGLPPGQRGWVRIEYMTQVRPIRENAGTFLSGLENLLFSQLGGDAGRFGSGAGRRQPGMPVDLPSYDSP